MRDTSTATTIPDVDNTNLKDDTGTADKPKDNYDGWYGVTRQIVNIEDDVKDIKSRLKLAEEKIEKFTNERTRFYENGAIFFKFFTVVVIVLTIIVVYICVTNLWDGIPTIIKEHPVARAIYFVVMFLWLRVTTISRFKDVLPVIFKFINTGKNLTE